VYFKYALTKLQAAIIAVVVIIGVISVAIYMVSGPAVAPTSPTTSPTPASSTSPTSTTSPPPGKKVTLVIVTPVEPEGLDIQQVESATIVHSLIYQPLGAFDPNLNVVPDLASDLVLDVEKGAIVAKIPENLKFSNGDLIDAYTIKAAVERYMNISPFGSDWEALDHIEVTDKYTIKFVFSGSPNYVWRVDIPTQWGGIVDVKVAEEVGRAKFNELPIASGPFKVKEWVRGSHIVLVKNENYRTNLPFVKNHGPPKIDEVIVRFITDDLTRASEFLAGKADILIGVPVDIVSQIKSNPDVKLYGVIDPGINYIHINVRRPPLDDLRVREAIMYAIDRSAIAQTLEDTVIPWYSFMSPTQMCFNKSVEEWAEKHYAYNLQKAKELLAEAGWADRDGDGVLEDEKGNKLVLELLSPADNPKLKRVAPLIQSMLAKVGIKVKIREFKAVYIGERIDGWDFELALYHYWFHEPAGILPYIWHSELGNTTYSNPEVDRLFEEDMTTPHTPEERTNLYTKVQMHLLHDLPGIPLYVDKTYVAVWNWVKNLYVIPLNTDHAPIMYFNDVEIAR